jgi:hypothetical protein
VHHTVEHMRFIRGKDNPKARCCVSGYSLLALRKIGEFLTVDRIDSSKGYVHGNMQLMAGSLNSSKGQARRVPQSAVNGLIRKMRRVANDRFSASKTPKMR